MLTSDQFKILAYLDRWKHETRPITAQDIGYACGDFTKLRTKPAIASKWAVKQLKPLWMQYFLIQMHEGRPAHYTIAPAGTSLMIALAQYITAILKQSAAHLGYEISMGEWR